MKKIFLSSTADTWLAFIKVGSTLISKSDFQKKLKTSFFTGTF